jgi:hypothetical protein
MGNYIVVLFKNKKKKKIIKKFITFNRAKLFYDKLVSESQEVIFDVEVEAGKECKYELGIIELSGKQLVPIYMTDEYGRNVRVRLDDEGMTLFQITPYKKEELIYDVKESKKISVQSLIKKYLKGDGMKMISVLNNKIVVQQEDKFSLFTLKNDDDSSRLLDNLSDNFISQKRSDCMFVKDYSTAQRKYLYSILSEKGFPKTYLFRQSTTHPTKT